MTAKDSPVSDADDIDDFDGEGEVPPKKSPAKKMLFLLLPIVLLLGGGGAAYMMGLFGGSKEAEEEDVAEVVPAPEYGPGYYYDMPDMLVNLTNAGRQQHFLKISVSLELPSEADVEVVDQQLPRVMDHFQTYLRELRLDDLRGSAGIYRLRQELLRRVEASVQPVVVRDVLFREILIQ